MKKVCHITSAHKRYDVRVFEKECRTSAKFGFETYLLVNDNKENELVNNVRIISSGKNFSTRISRVLFSLKHFYKLAKVIDAQIYHLHDPELLPLALKLKKRGKKVIFDSHEYYSEQLKEKNYLPKIIRKIITFTYTLYERYIFKRIDSVIYPCTLNYAKSTNQIKAKRITYLNNVPRLEDYYFEYEERKFNEDTYLCYAGTLSYDRGLIQMIKAAYEANSKLHLSGRFSPPSLYKDITRLIEFSSVQYHGYLAKNQVLSIYKKSSIGINILLDKGQYSITNNLSTKVYEYMAMGLPVILTETEYSKLILKEYPFGISVDPKNIEEIVNAIEYLKKNPDIASKMSKFGRKAILEKYNWELEEIKLITLYNDLLLVNECL